MKQKKEKRPSTECKDTKKSGLSQVVARIKSTLSEKCHAWHIILDGVTSNNALLEGTVNKTKAIKRAMFNRAKPDVLRAKVLYSGMKWDWNFHPN